MKIKFSKHWKSSKQPRKQRKFLANAPLHIRKKLVSVNLSKDLRKKHGIRNLPIKRGDTAKILKGKFKGKGGKVTKVTLKNSKIFIEEIQIKKQDGSKVNIGLRPSNLQIIELNLSDKKRNLKVSKNEKKENKEELNRSKKQE